MEQPRIRSVRTIRRKIKRMTDRGWKVPKKLTEELDAALKLNPEKQFKALPQKTRKWTRSYEGTPLLKGTTFGKPSSVRVLTGEELEARKRELEKAPG